MAKGNEFEVATLGGGCFWCIEAVFEDVEGVARVKSGYAGGHKPDPSYKEVCAGTTGHAEVAQVHFDPAVIPYAEILQIFFAVHDPTTLNRQGNDVGTQYRSVIFTHSSEQEAVARSVIAALNEEEVWDAPIVTQVDALDVFYPAEAYHDSYFRQNPNQPYCQVVVSPKVSKFRKRFAHRIRAN